MKKIVLVLFVASLPWSALAASLNCQLSRGGSLTIDLESFHVEIRGQGADKTAIESLFSSNSLCGSPFSTQKYGIVPAYNLDPSKITNDESKIYFSALGLADAKDNRHEVHYFPWSVQYSKAAGRGRLTCQKKGKNSQAPRQWRSLSLENCSLLK